MMKIFWVLKFQNYHGTSRSNIILWHHQSTSIAECDNAEHHKLSAREWQDVWWQLQEAVRGDMTYIRYLRVSAFDRLHYIPAVCGPKWNEIGLVQSRRFFGFPWHILRNTVWMQSRPATYWRCCMACTDLLPMEPLLPSRRAHRLCRHFIMSNSMLVNWWAQQTSRNYTASPTCTIRSSISGKQNLLVTPIISATVLWFQNDGWIPVNQLFQPANPHALCRPHLQREAWRYISAAGAHLWNHWWWDQ